MYMKRFTNMVFWKQLMKLAKQSKREQYKTKTVKVLVMGKSGVGKTAVINKLCDKEEFSNGYTPTCYDVHQKNVLVDEYNVTMQFMDLGGSQVFPSMQDVFIRQADIFLLVYSANDAESFHRLIEIRNLIVSLKNKHSTELPIVVVCNKTDCRRSKSIKAHSQSIHQWCYLVHNVSAKTGVKINAIMDSLIEESKFIGNITNVGGNLRHSGRYIYDDKHDGIMRKEQYHKMPNVFQKNETSDEQMDYKRRKSLLPERNEKKTLSFKKHKKQLPKIEINDFSSMEPLPQHKVTSPMKKCYSLNFDTFHTKGFNDSLKRHSHPSPLASSTFNFDEEMLWKSLHSIQ